MLAAIIVMLQLVTLPVLVSRAQEFDQQPEPGATSAPEPEPQIPAQEFSGEQPGQTEPFSLEGGLAVFDVVHDGGGNFILVLTDAEDERVDGLVNVIGGFDGSTAIHAPAGEYRLRVRGSDWSVTVRQPRYNSAPSLPVSRSGQGVAVTEPFQVPAAGTAQADGQAAQQDGDDDGDDGEPRPVTFAMTHQGDGNVRMTVLDETGRRATGVLNDRNAVDTTTRAELSPGIYLLNVRAAGQWTVEVE
ncbi:MAG: hypothetical protein BRC31_05270 [Actinobacteria bacterium QS_5_72_10]|nr:MAG: hypothetical protein BRC31_05270 [Actinobacteria bacterium QS_5_72_10]